MRWIKKNLSTIILVFILFVGLSLLLYPTVSDYWNSFHQSRAIASYAETVAEINNVDYEQIWNDAVKYNRKWTEKDHRWSMSEEEIAEYESLLDVSGNGIMGYIEIPEIKVSLPVYHGVDEGVLQIAIGHLPETSLPVGGKGTHCVISGHRGLPSAKLFTDLDQLVEGDIFIMRVLDETLTYEVDRILIVEPEDVSGLEAEEGMDYCTLVTCTPYGVNSHRLLVRGHRIENLETSNQIRITADAQQIDPVLVAPAVAVPILLLLVIMVCTGSRKRR